jgi:hypothetical protein
MPVIEADGSADLIDALVCGIDLKDPEAPVRLVATRLLGSP